MSVVYSGTTIGNLDRILAIFTHPFSDCFATSTELMNQSNELIVTISW